MTSKKQVEEQIENAQQNASQKIMDATVILNLSKGQFRIKKKARTKKIEEGDSDASLKSQMATGGAVLTDADLDLVRASKTILGQCDEFDAIKHKIAEMYAFVKYKALPAKKAMLKKGLYMIPIDLIEEVTTAVDNFTVEIMALADKFVDGPYQASVNEVEARLGSLFDLADYPSVEYVRSRYYVTYSILTFTTPTKLKTINKAIWQAEREKAQEYYQEIAYEFKSGLRATFQKAVAHLADRLQPGADGKRKRLYDSAITNVLDFMDLFTSKNVIGDSDMEKVVGEMRELLTGVDMSILRDDDSLRGAMLAELSKVTPKLDALVIEAPVRHIAFGSLDDEDDDDGEG